MRGDANIGTTKKGIGPAYTSKATRNGIRAGMLLHWDAFEKQLRELYAFQESQYPGIVLNVEEEVDRYKKYAEIVKPWIVDGVHFVNDAYSSGKRIITEGANAAMLDIDYGTYPMVTSSATTSGGICKFFSTVDIIDYSISICFI